MTTDCDVLVIGGGPAGAAAAIRARRAGLDVSIIDRGIDGRRKVGETIAGTCRPLLEALGAWSTFLADRHMVAHGTAARWGLGRTGYNDYIFGTTGKGWHLDRGRFDVRLLSHAREAGACLIQGHVAEVSASAGSWRLGVTTGTGMRSIATRFVIDAAGRRAAFSRGRGARDVVHDNLIAHVAFYDARERVNDHARHSLIEACPEGWWYSALIPGDEMVVCFMTDSDLAHGASLKRAAAWDQRLARVPATRDRLAGMSRLGPIRVVSAVSRVLDRVTGPGWLATGDAASTFDPLSSQGIAKALASGSRAGDAVAACAIGDDGPLRRYADDHVRQYETYLSLRTHFYRQETRWPDARFWRRRHARIELDPNEVLCANPTPRRGRSVRFLSRAQLTEMRAGFETPHTAHEGLTAFKAAVPGIPDHRLIIAVQHLIGIDELRRVDRA